LRQTRSQFGIVAVGWVVEQVEIAIVFLECQQDGDWLALCADDVARALSLGESRKVGVF